MSQTTTLHTSPCVCGGIISWDKQNVHLFKEVFKKLEVGNCDSCKALYLSDDSADLVKEKLQHEQEQKQSSTRKHN